MKKNHAVKKFVISSALAGTILAAPSIVDAALGDQTLRTGMTHSDVGELQEYLSNQGYYDYTVDNIFGPITAQAVRNFQRDQGIGVDGIAGPETFGQMNISSSSSSSSTSSGTTATASNSSSLSFNGTLRQGSRGQAVTDLQQVLSDRGHYNYAVDGIFGAITARAVRDFQRSAGITVDGIAGPQTYNALGSNSSSSNRSSGTTEAASSGSSSSSSASGLISTAKDLIGSPYRWGGTSPSGFDCSGFLNYVFNQNGQSLPRTVAAIWDAGSSVSSPRVGDIVFFATTSSGPSHAGIYLGNNQFIHSGTSTGVTISSMSNSYWSPRYLGAKSY